MTAAVPQTLTLAILSLGGVLSAQPIGPSDREIQLCLDRARPALHKHLRQNRGDVLALLCLAALHDGLPVDAKIFQPALRRLDRSVLRGTYGAALRLMVLAEDPACFGKPTVAGLQKRLAKDVRRILANRFGGGFSYAKRNSYWDLSNTQYAALGLRAASSLGHRIDPGVWQRMLTTVLAVQTETGGFGYTKNHRRKNAYASMTAAGIAVLQICKQHLPPSFCKPLDVDTALRRAWRWLAKERLRIGDIRTPCCLYFHYGLERAAVLSDVEKVGDVDWYRRGADMILQMQHAKKGSWRSSWEIRPGGLKPPGSPVDTAFAVLFLRRRFQKNLPQRYPRLITLGVQATDDAIAAAAQAMIRRGTAALPGVLRGLRSTIPAQRHAASRALRELTKTDFDYDPKAGPTHSADAIKAAELWWLRHAERR